MYYFEVLLNAGAKLTCDEDGWTPVHAAAASMTPDSTVIRLLVDAVIRSGHNALLEAKTRDGRNTALHFAASNDKAPKPDRYEITFQQKVLCSYNYCSEWASGL